MRPPTATPGRAANLTRRISLLGPATASPHWAKQLQPVPLGLGPDLCWADLLRLVENAYGKPIYFVAGADVSPTVSGLWVDTEEFGAVICFTESLGCARDQAILHELTHILLDHLFRDEGPHAEETMEAIASEIAKLLHAEPISDEERHFG